MYISQVSLVNYRNFKREKFAFEKGVNTIIGENGSGKSNLFRAMRLILDPNLIRYVYALNENDFHRGLGSWKGHWIIISIEFKEVGNSETIRSLFLQNGLVIDGANKGVATYNLIFRPKSNIRMKLSALEHGDNEGLNRELSSINIDDYETIFTGRSSSDFCDKETYSKIVGDFENVIFPSKIDHSITGVTVPFQLSIAKEVSFNYIKALRDVVSEFNNNKLNPLLNLLRTKSETLELDKYDEITQDVIKLNEKIESLDDVVDVRNDISETIKEAVGESYAPSSMLIKSDLPEDAEKLFKSLDLFVGESFDGFNGNMSEISLGGANLIYISLKILEFKYKKSKKESANFLLIEEPEAHIHTHIQKTLFENIDYNDTQIIYSTHSTQISEVSNIKRVNVLAKENGSCISFQPSNGLSPEEIKHLQRYLDATRSSLLFAKGVILVEGDAEEILIPLMVKRVFGISLDEMGISLINIRSTGFVNVANIFHKDRVRRYCSIITDLDEAIGDVIVLEEDDEKLQAYKKRMRASQKSGAERKVILDNFSKNNEYLNIFYANNTFEVDFIANGNSWEVDNIVDDVYKQDGLRERAKLDIKNKDKSIYGRRVLSMAKKVGKGWFAILLGDEISGITYMPDYIIKAIVFAKNGFSLNLCMRIVSYRSKVLIEHSPRDKNYIETNDILKSYTAGDIDFIDLKGKIMSQTIDRAIYFVLEGTNEI
ncbi:ATP-dependent nuclease [Serratia quinivorans]|uniref:ATP-dependent nuclease n=1 Tax=Serratia quinivorans TaxID=137545 RepID=UPI0021778F88|nr:AAA family ATPase [Serratia quinivorans]CAI1185050.1 recombination protein F [Serratia quinivorans]CAI2017532.1 recombination protein F [Serratia quinivorans]